MKRLVIFDLDGTLLNTIADLAFSTNYALEKNGFPVHPKEDYNMFVGNGVNKLLERALPEGQKTEENIMLIRKDFLSYYDEHNTDYSAPYPGIPALLNLIQEKGLRLAVASNKYQAATIELVKRYFSNIKFDVTLGQREGVPIKPDPTIVYDILAETGIDKCDAIYVGDSGVDMQTAKNSGVDAIGVTWGFRPRSELELFNPLYIVDKAEDIPALL
jgi:haloacid dehalogenase superfamily, subfamily IA, variant 1 with third motif having Dx(3-4)D or Dx(3-4)E